MLKCLQANDAQVFAVPSYVMFETWWSVGFSEAIFGLTEVTIG